MIKYWKIQNHFSFNNKEVKRVVKNGEKLVKVLSYRLQYINDPRFVERSLSNIVNNLPERIHQVKYQYGYDNNMIII